MQNDGPPSMKDVIEVFARIGKHPVFLHINAREKGPHWTGWAKITYEQTLEPSYQALLHSKANTGVLLGAPSENLCTFDWDTEAALAAFLGINPLCQETLQTHGARGRQIWLYPTGEHPHKVCPLKVHKDSPLAVGATKKPDDNGMVQVGEFRAEGGQSVICGIHPDGCNYTWPVEAPPITIAFDQIRWPNDIVITWEEERKAQPKTDLAHKASLNNNDLLKRAIAALTVDKLWSHFGFPERRTNPVASPLRTDNAKGHPSFSVYDQGRRFKDHNAAYEQHRGDSFDFYQLALGLDAHGAFEEFVELAGLGAELFKNQPKTETKPKDPTTSPVTETWDKKRFRREVREKKIPIAFSGTFNSHFGKQLGNALAPYAFFERAGRCVVLDFDYKAGVYQLNEVDPYGFRTDIEAVCDPYIEVPDPNTKKLRIQFKTIPVDLSRTVLATKAFLQELRPVYGFSTIRLPFRRPNGAIELLPEGYDVKSGILTSASSDNDYIKLAVDRTLEDAKKYLCDILAEFCFYDGDKDRALAVVIAAMLTVFLRLLLGPKVPKPAFLYTANAVGAGKTLLAKLAIIPTLGNCPAGTIPGDEGEFRKLIFASALADEPVLFLDNVEGYLSSSALASFLTSPVVQDRILGFSRLLKLEHNTVAFVTGNNATYSPDIRRRTLTVELFLQELRAEDRVINNPLDDAQIFEKRQEILAALWVLVREWVKAGQPEGKVRHESFRVWSKVIGGILEHAGFASPCTKPIIELSGETDTRDFETLVDKMNPGTQFKYADLVKYCAEYQLFTRMISPSGEQDAKQRSAFGKLLNRQGTPPGRILNGRYRFQRLGNTRDTRVFIVEDLNPGEPHV
jgi:hypothetical protein